MSGEFLTIAAPAVAQITEKKSRFIAYVSPVESEQEAQAFVEKIKAKHRDARHNVYAYVIDEQIRRSSDDGEPSGTAGKPTLDAIEHACLKNTVVVVTRYFGGILLGTGGLTRAYGKAAALVLAEAELVKKKPAGKYSITFDYTYVGKIEAWLARNGFPIEQKMFDSVITFMILIPDDLQTKAMQELSDITLGSVSLLDLGLKGFIVTGCESV